MNYLYKCKLHTLKSSRTLCILYIHLNKVGIQEGKGQGSSIDQKHVPWEYLDTDT